MAALELVFRKAFANHPAHRFLIVRLIPAAYDQSLNGVEQLEPIFQRWFRNGLPLVEPFLAMEEFPFTPDVLRVDLDLLTFVGDAFPTDFGFRHVRCC